jgi:thioredoxin-related protein
VDCDWGKKNNDISTKYGVRGYPTVIFVDPEGKEVDRVKKRDAASIIAQIEDVAKSHSKK